MMENFKLKVFRVLADTLNFRRAADELHLTQPAVTSQIKSLEENLGIALFDRIGRDISLTPAGVTLLQYVRQIEAITNDAVVALAPFGGQEGVELSIGASHTIAVYLLPTLLPRLLSDWPRLRIHVIGGSTNEVLHALTMHQISIGLIEAPAFRPDLKIEVFGEDELAVIVRPDHRWTKKPMLKAAELVQEPILLREEGSGMRRFAEEYLEHNGVLRQQLRTSIDMNSTEGIIAAVEAGLGVGFVPCLALEKALMLASVKAIPLENGPIRRQLSIALLNGPDPKGPVGQLIEILRENSVVKRHASIEDEANAESKKYSRMSALTRK
ncbi:MAG TPA: LysR family transcriptional regulator [Silvibacterium sp.]|jgi:DNA-binding transcriptional LysR family regulator|nr:LysR family transcriptional regulator [Silvibacterium sp.]